MVPPRGPPGMGQGDAATALYDRPRQTHQIGAATQTCTESTYSKRKVRRQRLPETNNKFALFVYEHSNS